MNRRATAVLLALVGIGLLCLSLGVASGAVGATTVDDSADSRLATGHTADTPYATGADTADDGFDRSVVDITVRADGSARWVFRYERALADDEDRDQFESFAERFRTEETELYENFRDDARALVDDGADATGREMAAEEFSRDAFVRTSLDNDIGVVELTFTWHGFGMVDDGRVVAGDVFEGGLYVGPDQEFVYRPGDDLAFESVDPAGTQSDPDSLAESSSVTWTGERQFTDRRPRAVLGPVDEVGGSTTDSSTATSTTTPTRTSTSTESGAGGGDEGEGGVDDGAGGSDGPNSDSLPLWLMVAVVIVGIGSVVAWQHGLLDDAGVPFDGDESRENVDGDESRENPDPSTADPNSTTPVSGGRYLSDEDRVVSLLQDNDGRMKQARIVEETSWSKSKVSVLLSEMEDDGAISRIRVGRENVVSLDGHEPEAARSPLYDE